MSSSDITSIQFRLQTLETMVAQQAQELKDLKAAAAEPPQDWVTLIDKKSQEAQEAKEAKEAKDAKDAKEAKDAKDAKDAKEAQEAKEAKEAQEAKEAKDAKDAKEAKEVKDIHTIIRVAKQLQSKFIPDIRTVLNKVDKFAVVNHKIDGRTLLECLSVFEDCEATAKLVTDKWWAMRVLLTDYPWFQAQIDAAMNKFLPLALVFEETALKSIVEFKHPGSNKPLVTFDQVQKVVAAEHVFGNMPVKNVKLMVSLMSA
jgi:chemotaxis protein histidine kinase CheA